MKRTISLSLLIVSLVTLPLAAQVRETRESKVRVDRREVEADGFWIYNDLPRAFQQARKTGKPMLVVFRCIPCENCAQLDAEIVDRDRAVRELLERFVCVRIVRTNGMDLSLFQYDYDQSFAAFVLNADKTIYGRYGTRSHRTESERDVSLAGFAKALQAALQLHEEYPKNGKALAGKRPSGPEHPKLAEFKAPEQFPALRDRYSSKLDYSGNVVRSCIHCHQVGASQRKVFREAGEPIPEKILFPYPNPKVLGLTMDPRQKARVYEVAEGSSAEQDGFRAGDEIASLAGQPMISIADIQWVLHNAGDKKSLQAEVLRGDRRLRLSLSLPEGWRRRSDISWRATSWDLRRMATGGLVLEDLSEADRDKRDLPQSGMALRVRHVGQYGDHAAAKRAGFRKEDVIVAFGETDERMSESELLAHATATFKRGERVPVTVLRDRRRVRLSLPMQ